VRKLKHTEIIRLSAEEARAAERFPIYVLADNIRSLHNLGAIFRTSDAFRLAKVYLSGMTGDPDSNEAHKTALGAQDTVPWQRTNDAADLLRQLKNKGFTIAALEIADESLAPEALHKDHYPLCIVLGHEVFGVADELMDLCDFALEIPQFGAKHSLNVSVAFGICAYQAVLGVQRDAISVVR
jgi:tRNA G18 (ribose-2'-O)-methylase SpoU